MGEREKAIAEGAVLARPAIMGLSHMFKALGSTPFDAEETKVGCQAGGMLAYSYGLYLDARVCFGIWALGVTIPRVTELILNWRAKSARNPDPSGVMREVKGQAVVTRVGA